MVLQTHPSAQLSQAFVGIGAKFRKNGGFIIDGVKKNHSGGRIFTPGIYGGQWGPHIVSTLKAQHAELVRILLFLWNGQKRKSFVFVFGCTMFRGICCDMSKNVFCRRSPCAFVKEIVNVEVFFYGFGNRYQRNVLDIINEILVWKPKALSISLLKWKRHQHPCLKQHQPYNETTNVGNIEPIVFYNSLENEHSGLDDGITDN